MFCSLCGSSRLAEFTAEVNVHFRGLQSLDQPSILVFPKLSVCLNCGLSRFTTPETELARLASGLTSGETSIGNSRLAKFGQNCA
jgi:hypothetical protein